MIARAIAKICRPFKAGPIVKVGPALRLRIAATHKRLLRNFPSPGRLCHKSVHGSTSSPRTDYGILKINPLAVRPEHVEERTTDCDTASGGRGLRGGGNVAGCSPSPSPTPIKGEEIEVSFVNNADAQHRGQALAMTLCKGLVSFPWKRESSVYHMVSHLLDSRLRGNDDKERGDDKKRRGDAFWIPASAGMTIFAFLTIFAFTPLFAAEPQNAAVKPAARVNGAPISQKEVDEAMSALIPQASYHRNVTPETMKELRKKALDNLIREELFYRAGLKKGYKVAKGDIGKRLEEIIKRYPSKNAFTEALKKHGVTEEGVRKKIEHMMLADFFLKEEVYKRAEMPEKDLLDYYKKNQEKFQKPEAVRLSHILIKVPPEAQKEEKEKLKKKAEEVYQKLQKGDDFEKLAWDNSDDPSRVKGGDLGVVHRGRLEPEVEGPAFAMKKGEMSGIVTSLYGYHILKVVDTIPPRQLEFAEIKDKLKKDLEEKEVAIRLADLVKTLRENAKIEIFTE